MNDYDNDQFVSDGDFEKEKAKYAQYAKNTSAKTKNINLRLSENDLLKVKSKAQEAGLPYQTLLSSLIHQYAAGRFRVSI